jgi:uncharacterized membrane protein (DUF485 family)/predicted RNA-binding Zn-ribbon protein involved in translation (DUF1610 family)
MKKKESFAVTATRIILIVGFVLGIGLSLYPFSLGSMSAKESTLLGVVLTMFSILATWLVTHLYSASQTDAAIQDVQDRSQANLRTYALKASEKVNNLSNELNKLALYLEQELEYDEYESPKEALSAREERIESAIHMIKTLKSVNDTSLSDWEGVIGDELAQQREEQLEKEEELKQLVERVEALAAHQRQEIMGSQENAQSLRSEVQSLKRDLRSAVAQLGGTPLQLKASRKAKKTDVEAKCPKCGVLFTYRQRPSEASSKAFPCKACGAKLLSQYSSEKGFQLELRVPRSEPFICPTCQTENTVLLDSAMGSSTVAACKSCNQAVRVARSLKGIVTRQQGKSSIAPPRWRIVRGPNLPSQGEASASAMADRNTQRDCSRNRN